jgi:hypothetical protein
LYPQNDFVLLSYGETFTIFAPARHPNRLTCYATQVPASSIRHSPDRQMDNLNYWRMCDDLSVIQCILLILDTDPKTIEDVVESDPKKDPKGTKL